MLRQAGIGEDLQGEEMTNQSEGVTFCAECGVAVTGNDVFCINCGHQVREIGFVPPVDLGSAPGRQNPFATVDPKQLALNARDGVTNGVKVARDTVLDTVAKLFSWLKRQIRWVGPIAALIGLGALYVGTQQIITTVMGPDAKLQTYVSAIKTGNFNALSDESLFPGSTSSTPDEFRKAWTGSAVANAHHEVKSREGLTATATVFIDNNGSSSFDLSLTGHVKWAFGFRIVEWTVDNQAPRAKFAVANRLYSGQTVLFGSDVTESTVSALRTRATKELTESYSLLPGVYTVKTSAAGFFASSAQTTVIWSTKSSESLVVDAKDPTLSQNQLAAATTKAVAANRACAKSKCKGMPKYTANDFNLWSQYTYDTYTNSVFSNTFSGGGCTNNGITVVAYNKLNIDFTCNVVVKANLYVRYIYYYGYYSNYWYYWNFKDSKTATTYPSVAFTASMDGSKITAGGARW